jgi:hypothetical protein
MALHPKERKRLKRQKIKEARRRQDRKFDRIERWADYYWRAVDCHATGDYDRSIKWSVKLLQERPNDVEVWNLALSSARLLGDKEKYYSLEAWRWKEGLIVDWRECFSIGDLALEHKDYHLASRSLRVSSKAPLSPERPAKQGLQCCANAS